jgi:hypothetical protein
LANHFANDPAFVGYAPLFKSYIAILFNCKTDEARECVAFTGDGLCIVFSFAARALMAMNDAILGQRKRVALHLPPT